MTCENCKAAESVAKKAIKIIKGMRESLQKSMEEYTLEGDEAFVECFEQYQAVELEMDALRKRNQELEERCSILQKENDILRSQSPFHNATTANRPGRSNRLM